MTTLRSPHRAPTHPGALLREDILPALGMTQTEFAERLGVSRVALSNLLHERAALSVDMAARIAKLLRTEPDTLLRMQIARDLWELDRAGAIEAVHPLGRRRLVAA